MISRRLRLLPARDPSYPVPTQAVLLRRCFAGTPEQMLGDLLAVSHHALSFVPLRNWVQRLWMFAICHGVLWRLQALCRSWRPYLGRRRYSAGMSTP